MLTSVIPGYDLTEIISEGINTIVYRARAQNTQQSVILKVLKADYPSLEQITRFKHEYKTTENLNCEGIVKIYRLESYQNRLALVAEDFDGVNLKEFLSQQQLCEVTFLKIAVQLAKALLALHQQGIIHKDIKPTNIIINPHTGIVKITDFSIASYLNKETPQLTNPHQLEGTVAYMSPEQTGRMNRTVDYRSDFYSLGMTFYEMLTGQLPFVTDDLLEMVHCHIAKPVTPITQLNPEISTTIDAIVMKLIAKNAEDRYQSALGLLADLEFCLEQLQVSGAIPDFIPGQRDRISQLLIPQQLYGRETEVSTLLAAFERVSQGKSEIMLVSGYSGIGKSSLVNEVHKPIVKQKGYFINGKFDQFKRNIPYTSVIQAFQSLMQQLLTENSERLEMWKEKLLQALGSNAQAIVDVIPEVELIIGKQPVLPQLGAAESLNRFNRVFQSFIQVFTKQSHPLVLFLDDLQWADSASLKLIQVLMTNPDSQYLLLIGAYRDNEVSISHPLLKTLAEIQQANTIVNNIILRPLEFTHVCQMVADTLGNSEKITQLARLLFKKTQGNPFFLNQLLKALYQENLLKFDFNRGIWFWDIEQIQNVNIVDRDVIELVAENIQKLPEATQTALQLAACIGNRFNLDVLTTVSIKNLQNIAEALQPALQLGLILPLNNEYRIPLLFANEELADLGFDKSNVTYRFLHDRIQQAAYSLIPDDQKQVTHLKIGQQLLQNTPPEQLEENIFNIINQLNVGASLITDPDQKQRLVELNLLAGRKAKASTAYLVAIAYLTTGLQLLPPDSWLSEYDLTLALVVEAAEAAYLGGDYELMESLASQVLQNTRTLLDRVKIYEVKIQAYVAQSRQPEAIKTALTVLELLGVKFPDSPSQADITKSLQATQAILAERSFADLIDLPEMTDPQILAVMRIIATVTAAVYQAVPMLLPLIVFKQVRLSIQYGNAPESTLAYAWYGVILCGVIGDIDTGDRAGQLALDLLSRHQGKALKTSTFNMVYPFVKPWKHHIQESLLPLLEAHHSGLETGDLEYSAYCAYNYCSLSYFLGKELRVLESEMATYSEALDKIKQEVAHNYLKIFRQSVLNLFSEVPFPGKLQGVAYNEDIMLPLHLKANDRYAIGTLYVNKLILCYLFGEYQQAAEVASLGKEYLDGVTGSFMVPVFHFYDSLTQLAILSQTSSPEKETLWLRVMANQEKLKQWADIAPMNHKHKFCLIKAEYHWALGEYLEAMDYYDRAIAGAAENGYIQEEALANERAAELYLSLGKKKIAQLYMTEAYYGYNRWGSSAKVKNLEKRYPDLILRSASAIATTGSISRKLKTDVSISTHATTNTGGNLDIVTVVKACEAINNEISLESLPRTLLHIILENAGAQKGCLILVKNNQLFIEAIDSSMEDSEIILLSTPVEDSELVPKKAINYVARTQQPLVIRDAKLDPISNKDPYIQRHECKSILCIPIFYQGKFIGIFYLENNLITGAFTPERLELLKILSSQAAIAIKNARLYAKEQEKSQDLEATLLKLQQTQTLLVHTEKISSLGQLVAGVAHEVNNPVSFIFTNLTHAKRYIEDLINLLHLYQKYFPEPPIEIIDEIESIDLDFLLEDLPNMISSMKVGTHRIRDIMQSLRNFSRNDGLDKRAVDIHEGIETTLMILSHRLKANPSRPKIYVVRNYGNVPQVACYPGQLNQVFMNLLANAIDALEESNQGKTYAYVEENPNVITITTTADDEQVKICIADNGPGMSESVKQKVFQAFFTTKPEGKGTGLGLSISYQIITEAHHGTFKCFSSPGEGAEFIIQLPIFGD
ncbi:trifunctional serine/threonine-protein kinase/ATP-binding protein/sensor histidine kinase [Calothrix sp. NIES-2098]|uniref:trifunctional serine/threonine-protein kinase/ATP-binding protein/sensor histidine kinase n=1 Tax=Calothrix sp. NIES-2098 TaxID=1954171 RepID=UPI000B61FA0F|nr:multi-sensor signal transduction multi-kinase [Calothrix sp. NIES-2098]